MFVMPARAISTLPRGYEKMAQSRDEERSSNRASLLIRDELIMQSTVAVPPTPHVSPHPPRVSSLSSHGLERPWTPPAAAGATRCPTCLGSIPAAKRASAGPASALPPPAPDRGSRSRRR
jgi:hypothetical protein